MKYVVNQVLPDGSFNFIEDYDDPLVASYDIDVWLDRDEVSGERYVYALCAVDDRYTSVHQQEQSEESVSSCFTKIFTQDAEYIFFGKEPLRPEEERETLTEDILEALKAHGYDPEDPVIRLGAKRAVIDIMSSPDFYTPADWVDHAEKITAALPDTPRLTSGFALTDLKQVVAVSKDPEVRNVLQNEEIYSTLGGYAKDMALQVLADMEPEKPEIKATGKQAWETALEKTKDIKTDSPARSRDFS